ncbi:MAG: hypothetical protein H6705_20460 [Myxococcales bacterium]|nr:hypothetical protein [Myxococcales bacterium]
MRPLTLAAVAALLAGCGSAPPPAAAPPPPPTLRTVAPTPAKAAPKAPQKRLVVLTTGAMPEDEAIQREIARQSLAVEVGSSPAGTEIALPGVECTIAPTERPGDVPKHFLPAEIAAHALGEDEAKAIGETTAAIGITCEISDDQMPVRGLPPMAEAAAEAIATLTDGYIHDPQTGRYYGKAAWQASRAETRAYAVDRNIRVLREKNHDTGDFWLGTRGLIAFGRPELEVFPVPEDKLDGVITQLQAIGDLTINEPEVASGLVMSLGTIDVLLIDRALYADTLPAGTTGKAHAAPGEALGRLALADPEAPKGDLAAHDAFLRRLLVR